MTGALLTSIGQLFLILAAAAMVASPILAKQVFAVPNHAHYIARDLESAFPVAEDAPQEMTALISEIDRIFAGGEMLDRATLDLQVIYDTATMAGH